MSIIDCIIYLTQNILSALDLERKNNNYHGGKSEQRKIQFY